MAWSRTGCQHSGMAMPSSLLISSRLVRQMSRAFLMSKVVLFFAWSNTLVSSHNIAPTILGVVVPNRALLISHLCCCSGLLCWLSRCVGPAGQDSPEVVFFNLYILPLGDGLCSVEEAGDNALFHMAWMVREVQISVCVGGLSVDAYVKGSMLMSRDPL